MTRTDQAPEPTMEEILASIRLIIADDAKKVPSGRGEEPPGRAALPKPSVAPLDALPEEEVLDLTDFLVFPEERQSNGAPAVASERQAAAAAAQEKAREAQTQRQEAAIAEPSEALEGEDIPPQHDDVAPAAEAQPTVSRSEPPSLRTTWSRREFPGSPPRAAPPVPRYEAPPRLPERAWAQDVQMAIPEHGPVPLIHDQPQTHGPEAAGSGHAATRAQPEAEAGAEAKDDAGQPSHLGKEEEAAVAAIAESIARSAAGSMNSEELATAGEVDFSKLGDEEKAEVTETFAHAIQRESEPREEGPLPTLLDEVLRQDFLRESSPGAKPAEAHSKTETQGARSESKKQASESRADMTWGAPVMPSRPPASSLPAPQPGSDPSARGATAPEKVPVKVAPVTHAHEAPTRLAPSRTPFEDAVRDMLRPLLVKWLDEHMPRILESAIREEMSTRGLLPNAEK